MDITAVPGIDVDTVTDWLDEHVEGAVGPFTFDVIAGGHSNLTYRVTGSDGNRFVLRRPPLGHVLASAHDMGREHRILSGLQSSAVPVPPVKGFCDDLDVNDAPFYVMGFVDGHVLRDRATAEQALTPAARSNASRSLVDTMAAIHAVDLESVGLSDLGRHDGYIERQLKRWYSQWNQGKTRELPGVDRVYDGLLARIPEQGPATIVHGDYRLDNSMVDDDGNVVAVLDWEICTLGDPLADVGSAPGVLDRTQRRRGCVERNGHHGARILGPPPALGALRGGVRTRHLAARLLRRLRVLEARLHHRGRVLAVPRRRTRRPPPRGTRPVQAPGRTGRRHCRALPGRPAVTDGRQDVEGVYEWLVDEPILHEPVLVVMLTGWIDAAGAAAAAADASRRSARPARS